MKKIIILLLVSFILIVGCTKTVHIKTETTIETDQGENIIFHDKNRNYRVDPHEKVTNAKALPERTTIEEILEDINNGYKLFADKELLKDWQNNFKGLQYIDEESGVLLRGAVDNILVKGEKLIVLDYKTRGYPLKEDTHEYYQTQMDLYTYLLKKNGYAVEAYAYLLFYYPNRVLEGGEVVFDTKLVKMDALLTRGEKVFKDAIKLLHLEEAPKATEDCGFCSFKINNI